MSKHYEFTLTIAADGDSLEAISALVADPGNPPLAVCSDDQGNVLCDQDGCYQA